MFAWGTQHFQTGEEVKEQSVRAKNPEVLNSLTKCIEFNRIKFQLMVYM